MSNKWKRIIVALTLVLMAIAGMFGDVSAAPLFQVGSDIADTPLGENTLAIWLAVLAILTSVAVSVLNRLPPRFTSDHKRIMAGIISGVFAIGDAFYRNTLDLANLGLTWMIVFLAASGFYVVITKSISDSVA